MPIKPLLVSLKDRVALDLNEQPLSDAFRQVELWSQTVTDQGLIGLPPPTQSPVTISYTDPTGQMWVAKAGVHGGQFRLARDVLHARVYRNAAFPSTATPTALVWDTVVSDPYALLPGGLSANFQVPVPGVYRVFFQVNVTATAAGQWMQLGLFGNSAATSNAQASLAVPMTDKVEDVRQIPVGGTFGVNVSSNVALAGAPGGAATFAFIDYLGSG